MLAFFYTFPDIIQFFQDLAVVVLLILIPLISPNSSKGGVRFFLILLLIRYIMPCLSFRSAVFCRPAFNVLIVIFGHAVLISVGSY